MSAVFAVIGLVGLAYISFWACVIFVYVIVWIFESLSKLLK